MINIFRKIKQFFRRERQELMPLDLEAIKRDEQMKSLLQQKVAIESQLGEELAKKHEEAEKEKSRDREKEFIERLRDDEKETKIKKKEKSFSWLIFFLKHFKINRLGNIVHRKTDKPIEVTDKNDEEILGLFGDLVQIEDDMAITDIHGNILSRGVAINHIIYKPETLANQMKRGRIMTPYIVDQDGSLTAAPDLENEEISDSHENERTGEIEESLVTDKAKNLIVQKNKIISALRLKIETLERTRNKMQIELADATLAAKTYGNLANESSSKLVQAMNLTTQFEVKVSEIERQNTRLTEMKAQLEDQTHTLDTIIRDLLEKLEGRGSRLLLEKARDDVLYMVEALKNLPAQTVIQNVPPEQKEEKTTMPGQNLGRQNVNLK